MDGDVATRMHTVEQDGPLGRWRVTLCRPRADLAAHVEQLWYGEGRVAYQRDRILPGGRAYLLINLGPPQYLVEPGPPERRVAFDDAWYSGLHARPIDTEAPHGNALLGVALRAFGSHAWLRADVHALADRTLSLRDVLGDGVARLRERLLSIGDAAARFSAVEDWLALRLDTRRSTHLAVRWAVDRIERSGGQAGVAVLARELGVSRKHLAELFRRQVGLTPKALSRVHRFRGALDLLAGHGRLPWSALAAHCGYYDQAHLVRDFHAFAGMTPGEFARHARADATSIVLR